MKSMCWLAVIAFVLTCPIANADQPVDIGKWNSRLQSIGAKYSKGSTQAQSNLARKELVKELGRLKSASVRMVSTVREVRWKDGVAEVYTESFLRKPASGAGRRALKVSRTRPFELTMDEASAAAIRPGARIVFDGRLDFQTGRWGAVGRAMKQQQLYTLNHIELGGLPLGTYTSPNAKILIDGKSYPNRRSP